MTDIERTAIAMLRSGQSWQAVSLATGLSVEALQTLWKLSMLRNRAA